MVDVPIWLIYEVLKGVCEKLTLTGCIIEGSIVKELVEYYNDYLSNVVIIKVPTSPHEGTITSKPEWSRSIMTYGYKCNFMSCIIVKRCSITLMSKWPLQGSRIVRRMISRSKMNIINSSSLGAKIRFNSAWHNH